MTYQDGALIPNVAHHVRAEQGAKEFAKKEISALMGVRSKLEALLFKEGVTPTVIEPDMTGIVRRKWAVGMAWHENSRDLGYAVGNALETLKTNGTLDKICKSYGVTLTMPKAPM